MHHKVYMRYEMLLFVAVSVGVFSDHMTIIPCTLQLYG